MRSEEYDNDKDRQPVGINADPAGLQPTQWVRLVRSNRMNRLVIDGLSGWSALTAVAAVMESPRMEVLLGLDAGIQVTSAGEIDPDHLPLRYAVCVDGPIEQSDAEAIEQSLVSGSCLLDAEIRSAASVLNRSGLVEVQGRSDRALLAVVAEMFRQFLAKALHVNSSELPLPEAGIIDSLLSQTGRLAIRAIETVVYPDFVDLGVVLPVTDEIGPAMTSVIFDRTSRTWHAD